MTNPFESDLTRGNSTYGGYEDRHLIRVGEAGRLLPGPRAEAHAAFRAREMKWQGSLNPNLSGFGERSEAREYSGRAIEDDWRGPFHTHQAQQAGTGSGK